MAVTLFTEANDPTKLSPPDRRLHQRFLTALKFLATADIPEGNEEIHGSFECPDCATPFVAELKGSHPDEGEVLTINFQYLQE